MGKNKRSDGLRFSSAMHCAQTGWQGPRVANVLLSSCCAPLLYDAVLRCVMRTINRAALLWSAREARSRWPVYGQTRPGILLILCKQQLSLVYLSVKLSGPGRGSTSLEAQVLGLDYGTQT